MRAWVCARHLAGMAAAAGLAACEQPAWLTGRDPLPPLAPWADALVGRPLTEVFAPAPAGACSGNVDQVEQRYGGQRPGARISGWGWDAAAKAPLARIVVTGPDGRISGGGESGRERNDVPEARPEVTSRTTGWTALTRTSEGEAQAYGVLADGRRACHLAGVAL
ncbi:hypothetical protein LRS10_01970 [Phenylobacterium sp. J426]|uniref:hypothetical protein n=1 Tax=Phenylobacterium sp. J426 TaxID=2898439 RepID=UPI0021512DF7|nr:hypothetical protein [Phenylobacterium sp. J426]MCR5873069.1 hypothetical protein [Phenylobacterium sp. J426]